MMLLRMMMTKGVLAVGVRVIEMRDGVKWDENMVYFTVESTVL